jgi:hypothetical protein
MRQADLQHDQGDVESWVEKSLLARSRTEKWNPLFLAAEVLAGAQPDGKVESTFPGCA